MFRRAVPRDFPEVRRITRDAYVRAGHFAADHPYISVLEDVEHRAEHAQVWVAEVAAKVVAAVTLTFAGQPYSEIAQDGEPEFRGQCHLLRCHTSHEDTVERLGTHRKRSQATTTSHPQGGRTG